MSQFLAELKRRQMFRVAAAYAVVAWLLLQVFNNVAPILEFPPWVGRVLLLLLVIGFPITLLILWLQRLSPADGAVPAAATSKLDLALIGALVVVIGLVSYQQLSSSSNTPTAQQASIAPTPSQPQPGGISIAVLPFANLSGDASQEFFSDGITEEITTVLSKVPSLLVVARTSAFEFKNQNRNIRAIGQALSARYVIDGSVRRAGNRVRIAAQLIQADNGVNIWADSYDRELTDVFAIQEEIAEAIAGALRAPLGLQQGERLVSNRTTDLDSYQQYLHARALYRLRQIDEAIAVLEPAVARDPDYAPAWGLLAQTYVQKTAGLLGEVDRTRTNDQIVARQAFFERAEKAAQESIRLDSRNANGHAALADIQYRRGNWAAAEDIYRQALALGPNDPDVLNRYGVLLSAVGRVRESLNVAQKISAQEPLDPNNRIGLAVSMQRSGQYEASIQILEAVSSGPGRLFRNRSLAEGYARQGRYGEAADALLALEEGRPYSRQLIEDAARLLRSAPAKASEPLPDLRDSQLSFVYAHVGAMDRILESSERDIERRYMSSFGDLWRPEYASLRKTERFKAIMRNSGLVDYWRARGWPDLCRPVGTNDFVCD